MEEITIYSTSCCVDCRRAKRFLKEHEMEFSEINIDEGPDAKELVLQLHDGRRMLPTIQVGNRYFPCSPFDLYQLSSELSIPLSK